MIFRPCIQSVLLLVEPQNATLGIVSQFVSYLSQFFPFHILFAIKKWRIMDLAAVDAKS